MFVDWFWWRVTVTAGYKRVGRGTIVPRQCKQFGQAYAIVKRAIGTDWACNALTFVVLVITTKRTIFFRAQVIVATFARTGRHLGVASD